jgi:stress response protein YsnF
MQRAVTAIYPTPAVADLVRRDLEQIGIAGHNITILPDSGLSTSGTQGFSEDAIDRLHDLGLPEDDIRTYQQALRNGDYVVSVEVDDEAHLGRVQEIMRQPENAYDLDELDSRYSAAEYTPPRRSMGEASTIQDDGFSDRGVEGGAAYQMAADASAGGLTGTGVGTDYGTDRAMGSDLNEDGTVKVVEERLAVGKREAEAGRVRVRSYVREVPVEAAVDLRATRVYVERRPVDRAVTGADAFQDRTIEARETAEEAVVAKEARVVEEIGLREETEVQHQTIHDTVRKTEVEVEDERTGATQRISGDATTGSGTTGGTGGTGGMGGGSTGGTGGGVL